MIEYEEINLIATPTDNFIEDEGRVFVISVSEKFIKEFNKNNKKINLIIK